MLNRAAMEDVWGDPHAPRGIDNQVLVDALPELQQYPPMMPVGVPSPLDGLMAHPGPMTIAHQPQSRAMAQWQQTDVPTMHLARPVDRPDPWPMVAACAVAVCGLAAPLAMTAMQSNPNEVAMQEFGAMAREMGRPSYTCVSWRCPAPPAEQFAAPAASAPVEASAQTVIFQAPGGQQRRGVIEAIAGRDDAVMIRFVDNQMEAY